MKVSSAVVFSILSGAWRANAAAQVRGFDKAGQEQPSEGQGHRHLAPADKILVCKDGKVVSVSENALNGLLGMPGGEVCAEGATCGPDGCQCDAPINPILSNGIDPAVSYLGTGCQAPYKWLGDGGNLDEDGNTLADGGGFCLSGGGDDLPSCRFEMDSYEEAIALAVSECDAEVKCIGFTYDILGCGCPSYFETCDAGPAGNFCPRTITGETSTVCWDPANLPGKFSVFLHYSSDVPASCVDKGGADYCPGCSGMGPIANTNGGTAPIACPGNDNAYSCHCKLDGNGACISG